MCVKPDGNVLASITFSALLIETNVIDLDFDKKLSTL